MWSRMWMAGWRTILTWRNPTRDWRADPSRPLILDLDNHRLSGVGIGDPAIGLSFLGPAAEWSFPFVFPNHGLAILGFETIEELNFYFDDPAEPNKGCFRGESQFRGNAITLTPFVTERDVLALFGEPYWRDADSDETILFYEFPGREWHVEFGANGRLKCLVVGLPILADCAQRQAYGVTKVWPPT